MDRQPIGPDGLVPLKLPKRDKESKEKPPTEGYQPLPTDDPDAKPDAKPLEEVGRDGNEEKGARTPESWGVQLLENNLFQSAGACLIMANALVIGMETDIEWKHWDIVENLFLLLFTCELLMKVCILGPCAMFSIYHPDFHWSAFDAFIVGLGLFDFTMTTLGGASMGGFATLFRIIRLLRIMRIFRIIKFLKQLYLLAFGLVEATKAIFWVSVLMSFILYVTSIVLVKTIGRPPESDAHYEFMNYKFGSIIESMLSLFVLMSSPNLPVYQDEVGLLAEKPFFCIFLVLFITFGSFGIIAMLTGVISESMFEKNEMRKAEAREEHEEMRANLGTHCGALFMTIAMEGTTTAHIDDICGLAPQLVHMLELAGGSATVNDITELVDNMYTDDRGNIDVKEFVETLEKVADGLSPFSIQEIEHAVGNLHKDVSILQTSVNDIMGVVQKIASQTENDSGPRPPPPAGKNVAQAQSPEASSTSPQPSPADSATDVQVDLVSRQTLVAEPNMAQPSEFVETLLASIADLISKQTLTINRHMVEQCKEVAASHELTLRSLGASQQSCSQSFADAGAESVPFSSLAKQIAIESSALSPSQALAPASQGAAPIDGGSREEHHLHRLLEQMNRVAKQRRSPDKVWASPDEGLVSTSTLKERNGAAKPSVSTLSDDNARTPPANGQLAV